MSLADAIGSVGVAILLAAFFLNLRGVVSQRTRAYQLMNATGAALACYASWRIGFLPFVVLEGLWCAVAVTALRSCSSSRS